MEQEKYIKLQKEYKVASLTQSELKSEMAKLNRTVSQKQQKIELQSMEINRLQKENEEKLQLSEKLSKLQISYRVLEEKWENQIDESNELAMTVIVLSAEIERINANGMISKEFLE